jgi:predicted lipid-binding transport protein (Tim44 family)
MEAIMNLARIFAVVVTLGVLSTASSQETPKQDPAPAAKPADAPASASQAPNGGGNVVQAPSAPSSGAAQPAAQEPEKVPPPPSAAAGKTGVIKDNEFIPTEEIQPDEAVTFPVDI